jgi:Lrp/AsnC family leucine-responsive transcriptional regulator
MAELDETDRRIVDELRGNSRMSMRALAAALHISRANVYTRVARLERDGVITGYTARIDPAGVGRSLDAFIDVRLLPTTDSEEFEQRVARLDSVREVAFLTGRFDFQLRVACRDADDLNDTVRAVRREAGAAGTETRIVLRSTTFERAPAG